MWQQILADDDLDAVRQSGSKANKEASEKMLHDIQVILSRLLAKHLG